MGLQLPCGDRYEVLQKDDLLAAISMCKRILIPKVNTNVKGHSEVAFYISSLCMHSSCCYFLTTTTKAQNPRKSMIRGPLMKTLLVALDDANADTGARIPINVASALMTSSFYLCF